MTQAQGAVRAVATSEEILTVRRRIVGGRGARGLVAWAIQFAQKDLSVMTGGDWYNLQLELAAFATDPRSGLSGREGVPSDKDVREIQQEFARIFSTLIRDGQVKIGRYEVNLIVHGKSSSAMTEKPVSYDLPYMMYWFGFVVVGRSTKRVHRGPGMLVKALTAGEPHETWVLGMLLQTHAHLVKACPAPRPRSTKGEVCGRWFLANRPNQAYCSRRCQSRTTTRESREAIAKTKESGRKTTTRRSGKRGQ